MTNNIHKNEYMSPTTELKNIKFENYSEKSFVIRGNTKPYKELMKDMGGKWNAYLKDGPGWIFSKKHLEKFSSLVDQTDPVRVECECGRGRWMPRQIAVILPEELCDDNEVICGYLTIYDPKLS